MPKPTIEQLEAEKKKAAAELEKAMQKKEQLEHQMSRLLTPATNPFDSVFS